MLQAILCGIIKYQVVIHQIEQDIGQFILLDGNIGSDPATVAHFAPCRSVEYCGEAVRNTSHTTVFITVLIVDGLHATAAWDIIFGSGQLHCTAIRQWTGSLHKPLSKCTVAHHHCTIVILQCTRQNLRCRSRSAVHQYSQRDFQIQRLAQGLIRIARLFDFSFRSHQRFAPWQEEVGYFHRLIQQTAAIIAQVDHQRSDSLFLQIKKRLLKLFGRIAGESAQVDVTDVIVQHRIIRNKRQLDGTTDNVELQRLFRSGTLHFQLETCAHLSAKHFAHFLVVLSRKVFAVNLHKDVTRLQTYGGSRHIFVWLGYHRPLQLGVPGYDRADTAIRIFQHLLQLALVVFRKILCIRIERVEHRLDAGTDRFVRIYRIHIEHIQFFHNRIEYIQIFGYLKTTAITTLESEKETRTHCQQQDSYPTYF